MGYVAHDRSERLVSAKELPQPLDISVPYCEEGETRPKQGAVVYNLSIVFVRSLDTNELTK